jgi:hypothetical protein
MAEHPNTNAGRLFDLVKETQGDSLVITSIFSAMYKNKVSS